MRTTLLTLSTLLGTLCGALPRANMLPAQQPPSFSFVYLIGADTVGAETVTVRDTIANGVLSMRGQPRIEWTQVMVNRLMRTRWCE